MSYLSLIPKSIYVGSPEVIDLPNGFKARIALEYDQDADAPWENDCGRGPVSEWTTREKKPGERTLCSDRSMRRYYDYAEAIKIAKRDGWDAPPYKIGTKGERAARAVSADFEVLRAWCNDEWHYVGVVVDILDADGDEIGHEAIRGIESYGDYWREVAAECISNALHDAREHIARAEQIRCFC